MLEKILMKIDFLKEKSQITILKNLLITFPMICNREYKHKRKNESEIPMALGILLHIW